MPRVVCYASRDIGYGVEEDQIVGHWGETDWTGKRELTRLNGDQPVYLFPDEVLSDEPLAPVTRPHFRYCPACSYFNDTCTCPCPAHQSNHAGIEHDNCERPTNAWPKGEGAARS